MATKRQLELAVEVLNGLRIDSGGWGVPTMYQDAWTLEAFQEALAAAVAVLEGEGQHVIVVSFGLIPETYTFNDRESAYAFWVEQVNEVVEQSGLENVSADGEEDWELGNLELEDPGQRESRLQELYDSGFVTDWNKWELRWQ